MKYLKQAIMFGDLANGGWLQQYRASLEDGTPTDIVMTYSKPSKKADQVSKYTRGDVDYPTLKDSFKAWFADNGREYPSEEN